MLHDSGRCKRRWCTLHLIGLYIKSVDKANNAKAATNAASSLPLPSVASSLILRKRKKLPAKDVIVNEVSKNTLTTYRECAGEYTNAAVLIPRARHNGIPANTNVRLYASWKQMTLAAVPLWNCAQA